MYVTVSHVHTWHLAYSYYVILTLLLSELFPHVDVDSLMLESYLSYNICHIFFTKEKHRAMTVCAVRLN